MGDEARDFSVTNLPAPIGAGEQRKILATFSPSSMTLSPCRTGTKKTTAPECSGLVKWGVISGGAIACGAP